MSSTRTERGWEAFDEMAQTLAIHGGTTPAHARKLLRLVYALIREEIARGRYVMPGILTVVKRAEEVKRGTSRYKATVRLDACTAISRKVNEYRRRQAA